VALILDSGALYAAYDADDRHHESVLGVLRRDRPPFVVPAAILAEADYLLVEFLGVDAELKFLDAVRSGYYSLEPLTAADLDYCRRVIARYRDLEIGLADAAVMAAAERLGINRIVTLDTRDFRAVKPERWTAFDLLPG
jgi:predicted nucleic acid-binding protein